MKEELNSFDDRVKDILANHQVPYDDSTWNLLQHRMVEAEQARHESVDEMAKRSLGNLQVPYNHQSWNLLSDRLDRISYRKRVIALKIVEAAAVLLFILSVVRFATQIPDLKNYLPLSINEQQIELPATSAEGVIPPVVVRQDFDPLPASSEPQRKALPLIVDASANVDINPAVNQTSIAAVQVEDRTKHQVALLDTRVSESLTAPIRPVIQSAEELPALEFLPVNSHEEESVALVLSDFKPRLSLPAKISTGLGMFYQHNTHLIENLSNLSQAPSQKIENSRGAGLMANVKFGNFGFDLGGSYTGVEYKAGTGHNEIHKLQLPVHFRYEGIRTQYADFYVKAGASLHAVLHAHYESNVLFAAAPGGTRNEPKFNSGLLEGGYKENNVYYSLNAGFGAFVPITKSTAFFSEVLYLHHWDGALGFDTRDQFRTFTLNAGISYSLR